MKGVERVKGLMEPFFCEIGDVFGVKISLSKESQQALRKFHALRGMKINFV